MSQLLTSFGIFFGFIALLIVGVKGMTTESFALAAIVVVCGMLVALFVVDGVNGKAPSSNKSGWLRKWRRRLKKHRVLWAFPLLGLGGWAGYFLLAGESANAPTSASSSTGTAAAVSQTPTAAPPALLIAAPTAADPESSATPAQEAPTPQASNLDAQQEVAAAVESWRSAWANKDIDTYLAAYAPDFKPADGLALQAWRTQRQERLALSKDIRVDLVNPTTEVNGESATVRFQQRYQAGTFTDKMRKQLTLARQGGQWKITEERPDTKSKP